MQGTVVWFSAPKGFGFLKNTATGKEYFCHFSAIQSEGYRKLEQGQTVQYEVEVGKSGREQACNVVVVD